MDKIKVKNIFAAVFEKSVLDGLLTLLDKQSLRSSSSRTAGLKKSVKFWGTEGTVKYLRSKGFKAISIVSGFDFDGRVKSLDRGVFVRILADRSNNKHLEELRVIARSKVTKQSKKRSLLPLSPDRDDNTDWEPFDAVIVDLYAPDPKIFPESMDIGGQSLIRSAIKNYKSLALAFDEESLEELVAEIKKNNGSTSLDFRKKQAQKGLKFITARCKLEAEYVL